MSEYYKIINNENNVIARIKGREFAHMVAEFADDMRPMYAPHGVQEP